MCKHTVILFILSMKTFNGKNVPPLPIRALILSPERVSIKFETYDFNYQI
jgi:hypothetical protein